MRRVSSAVETSSSIAQQEDRRPPPRDATSAGVDEIEQIVDEYEAAAVVDAGEGQRQAAVDEAEKGEEVRLHPGPIDQRRAEGGEDVAGGSARIACSTRHLARP